MSRSHEGLMIYIPLGCASGNIDPKPGMSHNIPLSDSWITYNVSIYCCSQFFSSASGKYYLKNNYLTLRSKVNAPGRSLRYATRRLMGMHPHTKYHWPILKEKNVMARTRKYYLKNNYLTLRSNVKVPRRSLRYATHRFMVIHPHAKYHWPNWSSWWLQVSNVVVNDYLVHTTTV
jgi:hypothetical protein